MKLDKKGIISRYNHFYLISTGKKIDESITDKSISDYFICFYDKNALVLLLEDSEFSSLDNNAEVEKIAKKIYQEKEINLDQDEFAGFEGRFIKEGYDTFFEGTNNKQMLQIL